MPRDETTSSAPRRQWLFESVDIASIVVFRIGFGAIMFWEFLRFWTYGWVSSIWIEPGFHFTYFGFEWLRPWPGHGMHLHVAALTVLAVAIAFGFAYRGVVPLFFVGFTYLFLLEQARYLNHFYLLCVVALLLAFVPAHRAFSVDAWRNPAIRSGTVPSWTLILLRGQIGLVYVLGGVAKLNGDWLRAEPLRTWLRARGDMPLIGPLLELEWTAWFFAYSGLLIDLLIVPLLLWKRTRVPAFLVATLFHLLNSQLFTIGIFPWFMIVATTLFFPPDWPRRLLAPAADGTDRQPDQQTGTTETIGRFGTAMIAVWFAIQLLVPMRHLLYPGVVHWTEEGHRFSWHMKLRDKEGEAWFQLLDPQTNRSRIVYPDSMLPAWQSRKMKTHPDMILQFAHHLADLERRAGREGVEVRASVMATLHGRPYQLLVDPTVDLARVPRTLRHATWIVPLKNPLPTNDPG